LEEELTKVSAEKEQMQLSYQRKIEVKFSITSSVFSFGEDKHIIFGISRRQTQSPEKHYPLD